MQTFHENAGVTPDVLVLPPKAGIYVSMVPPSEQRTRKGDLELTGSYRRTDWYYHLPRVQSLRGAGVRCRFPPRILDLTARPRMIGEYFVIPGVEGPRDMQNIIANGVRHLRDIQKVFLTCPIYWKCPGCTTGTCRCQNSKSSCDLAAGLARPTDPYIHIYSADVDNWVKICYEEANAHAFNGGAEREQIGRMFDELQGYLHGLVNRFNAEAERRVGLKNTPREKKQVAAAFTGHADNTPLNDIVAGRAAAAGVAAIAALHTQGAARVHLPAQLALVQQRVLLAAGGNAQTAIIVNRLVEIAFRLDADDTALGNHESSVPNPLRRL